MEPASLMWTLAMMMMMMVMMMMNDDDDGDDDDGDDDDEEEEDNGGDDDDGDDDDGCMHLVLDDPCQAFPTSNLRMTLQMWMLMQVSLDGTTSSSPRVAHTRTSPSSNLATLCLTLNHWYFE